MDSTSKGQLAVCQTCGVYKAFKQLEDIHQSHDDFLYAQIERLRAENKELKAMLKTSKNKKPTKGKIIKLHSRL